MRGPEWIAVDDPGFRWGWGVFETLQVRGGRAIFHQMHLENIAEAAQALGLPMPDPGPWSKAPREEGIWRWFLTPKTQTQLWEEGLPEVPSGMSMELSPLVLSRASWEARYKTLSYLTRQQARQESGSDEALLLNEKGQIASACMANVFWVREGILHTPDLECGCRDGVLRRWVLESWAEECRVGAYEVKELEGAEEIFLTNSRLGVMPVHSFEGRNLEVGRVVHELRARYAGMLERL
ncbi:MAG: aminotransferase class IV [Blastochloris sp.]|nr:aminotransferase class IV [Blastochloris sp.]